MLRDLASVISNIQPIEASDIVEFRRVFKISQGDFGALLGLTRHTISRLESGAYKIPVSVGLAIRYMMALGDLYCGGLERRHEASFPARRAPVSPPPVEKVEVRPRPAPRPPQSKKKRKKKRR